MLAISPADSSTGRGGPLWHRHKATRRGTVQATLRLLALHNDCTERDEQDEPLQLITTDTVRGSAGEWL